VPEWFALIAASGLIKQTEVLPSAARGGRSHVVAGLIGPQREDCVDVLEQSRTCGWWPGEQYYYTL
jgi:hypothetical protein